MSDEDESISLHDSGSDFSGFDPEECTSPPKKKKKNLENYKIPKKSQTAGPEMGKDRSQPKNKQTGDKRKRVKSAVHLPNSNIQHDQTFGLDFSKLSPDDIESLRGALGLNPHPEFVYDNEPEMTLYENENLPNIHVSIDQSDMDDDVDLSYIRQPVNVRKLQRAPIQLCDKMSSALCDDRESVQSYSYQEDHNDDAEDQWELPKLRLPEKGPAISSGMAKLVNVACTNPCDLAFASELKMPDNCSSLGAPLVNTEVWKVMDKRSKTNDRDLANIQNMLATSMVPLFQLSKVIKPVIKNDKSAKQLMSQAMTLIGQAQYQLSIKRRYQLRPNLNRRYTNLCSAGTPISSMLFGDDISKEVKTCDTGINLGKDNFKRMSRLPDPRKPLRQMRYNPMYEPRYEPRYQNYHSHSGYQGPQYSSRGHRGQYSGRRGAPRNRRLPVSATVTSEHSTKN